MSSTLGIVRSGSRSPNDFENFIHFHNTIIQVLYLTFGTDWIESCDELCVFM